MKDFRWKVKAIHGPVLVAKRDLASWFPDSHGCVFTNENIINIQCRAIRTQFICAIDRLQMSIYCWQTTMTVTLRCKNDFRFYAEGFGKKCLSYNISSKALLNVSTCRFVMLRVGFSITSSEMNGEYQLQMMFVLFISKYVIWCYLRCENNHYKNNTF